MRKPHTLESILNLVKKTDSCWIWQGCKNNRGYGRLKYNGKVKNAHRHVYELLVAPVDQDMVLDHLCKNKSCVNPQHLEVVTNTENVMRAEGVCALNAKKTHCKHGHEFTELNTYRTKVGRVCKQCLKDRKSVYRSRIKELKDVHA